MINHLSIQGLAIIDSLAIDFSAGFNVITGETGAGKSILIRALGFLMGAKASSDSVRKGSSQATVTGEFTVPKGHQALTLLEGIGIDAEESAGGYSIIIRRQVTAKGRSQSWINDVSVTSQPLRELGATLVDVFGQHENQRLMDPLTHISYVDEFLGNPKVKDRVDALGAECNRLLKELQNTLEAFNSGSRSRDYLDFRLEELKSFSPSRGEYEKTVAFCQAVDGVAGTRDSLVRALGCLESGESGESVNKAVWETSRILAQLENPPAELLSLKERAAGLARELDDFSFELGKYVSGFDFDEQELEAYQQRLYGYQDLFRKHSVKDIESLMGESERLVAELGFLETAAAKVEEGMASLQAGVTELIEAAKDLTRVRKTAAKTIKKSVESELHELAMPGSSLEVEWTKVKRVLPPLDVSSFGSDIAARWNCIAVELQEVGEGGAERCQFLLSSNPGEPMHALTRIASGGELSRIMLALKKSLAADAETCVLVFDEIDAGISGRVADVVGRKMRELAGSFQVICISHLPQVAVYADTHFLVAKGKHGDRTESSIVRLSHDESAREIARLLSGAEVSTPSLANARSLMEKARNKKTRAAKESPQHA